MGCCGFRSRMDPAGTAKWPELIFQGATRRLTTLVRPGRGGVVGRGAGVAVWDLIGFFRTVSIPHLI